MLKKNHVGVLIVLMLAVWVEGVYGLAWYTTRVSHLEQHFRKGAGKYPYREKLAYILQELDLQEGDVVMDIGAGDGWWSEQLATEVGKSGKVYAGEVEQKLVNQMKEKYAGTKQIDPMLIPYDGTGLLENVCDLVFISQTYHHFDAKVQLDYLKHLKKVIKPMGRLCIIERYLAVSQGNRGGHGTDLSELVKEAEEAGWVLVRYELMPNMYHYLTIFVQKELFPKEFKNR